MLFRSVRLWEPLHGEVVAQPRSSRRRYARGTRAYLSAGLPGADWWVAGQAVSRADEADVDLAEVERLYAEHDLWPSVFSAAAGASAAGTRAAGARAAGARADEAGEA